MSDADKNIKHFGFFCLGFVVAGVLVLLFLRKGFLYFLYVGFSPCYQAGLELLSSSDPLS